MTTPVVSGMDRHEFWLPGLFGVTAHDTERAAGTASPVRQSTMEKSVPALVVSKRRCKERAALDGPTTSDHVRRDPPGVALVPNRRASWRVRPEST